MDSTQKVGAGCGLGLLVAVAATFAGVGAAQAQGAEAVMAPGAWRLSAQQARASAALDGDLVNDPGVPLRYAGNRVDSWARSTVMLAWAPRAAPAGLSAAAFIDSQVHVTGVGATAAARINSDAAASEGRVHEVAFDSVSYRRQGLGIRQAVLRRDSDTASPHWQLGAKVFAVDRYKSASAVGVLEERAGDVLSLQGSGLEQQLGKSSLFVRPEKVLGWGVGMDLQALWGDAAHTHWRAAVEDLGPTVRLSQVLVTSKTVNTNTVSHDAQGYVQFAPAVMGRYDVGAVALRIKPQWLLDGAYELSPALRGLAGLRVHGALKELRLGADWAVTERGRAQLLLRRAAHMSPSLDMGWQGDGWRVAWQANQWQPGRARTWALSGACDF
jgi:hypothetical protein